MSATAGNGIEERITELLKQHQRRIDCNHPAYGQCYCGFNPEDHEELYPHEVQAQHVASVLVTELGMRQRFTWSWPNGSAPGVPGYGFEVDTAAEAAQEGEGVLDVVSRYVTSWEPT